MTSLGSRIISATMWVAAETWSRQGVMFAVFIVLARLLGPEDFGLAALSMVAPLILAVPVTIGIPEALIQRKHLDPAYFDSNFWFLTTIGFILSLVIWLFAGVVAIIFNDPRLEELVRWTSVIVAIQGIAAIPIAILKRQLRFRVLTLRTLVGTFAGGVVGIVAALSGFGVWSLVWMQIVRSAFEAAVLLLGSGWRPQLRYSFAHCRELFGFAGPIVTQSFTTFINDEMPKIALGTFLGPGAVGIYTLARRPLDLLTAVILTPFNAVAMPAVSRVQHDTAKIDKFFNSAVRMGAIIGFPAFLGFAAIAPDAVPYVFGTQWTSAVPTVQILMLLGLLRTIDIICGSTILALGHSGLLLKLNVLYMVIAAALLFVAAQLSIEATAAAVVVCNLVLLPIFLLLVHRIGRIDVSRPLAVLPRLTIAALLMVAAVTVWRLSTVGFLSEIFVIAGGITVGCLAYGIAVFALLRPDVLAARDMLASLRGDAS